METNKTKNNQDYINEWLLELKNVEKRPETTLRLYGINIGLFIKYLDSINKSVTETKMVDIRGFFGANEWSIKTCKNKQSTIRSFYDWMCEEERYMLKNPLGKGIDFGKESRLPKILDSDSLTQVIYYLGQKRNKNFTWDRNFVIFQTIINAGTRRAETINIKVKDLDLNGKVAILKVIGKGNKERQIPLPESLRGELKRFIKKYELQQENYLFTNEDGSQLCSRYLNDFLQLVEISTGIKITPHTGRHVYATRLIKSGADIKQIQTLLGHSDVSTTGIYLHTDVISLGAMVQNLDK